MSSSFEFNCSGDNWKVDKKSKEYKRLKELFPDCDIILSLDKRPVFENDGGKYPSVLQFLAKDINKPVGEFIFEEPLDDEVYKLVDKLTNKKWWIDIYIIKTYDSEGSTWTATGKITTKGIDWDIIQNEDEEQEDEDNSGTSLINAVEEGDTKTVKMLLEKGANIEETNDDGETALCIAARECHADMVKLLVNKGADIEAKTDRGVTPLFLAAINGRLDTIKILIEAGANIHVKNRAGKTAQMRAEEQGHTEVVKYLKKYAVGQGSIDSPTKRKTEGGFAMPKDFDHLHYIACIFKIFVDKVGENLSPDVTNKMTELLQEWLPEDLSAPKIFKMIQPKLNELYNHDAGMLAYFLKTATQEIMEVGIFKESNLRSIILDLVDIAEVDGKITENEAKFINRIAQYFGVKFNITATVNTSESIKGQNDSDIDEKDENGMTALIRAAEEGDTETVKLLLDQGADIEAKNNDGLTALHTALENGRTETAALLIARGADVEAEEKDSPWKVQHWAAWEGLTETIELLLDKGADIEAKDKEDGCTALHHAANGGHTETVELLLNREADIEATDNDGRTALMKAASNGHTEVVELLLDKGADIKTKNNDGKTAQMMAEEEGYTEIVKVLIEKSKKNEKQGNKEDVEEIKHKDGAGALEDIFRQKVSEALADGVITDLEQTGLDFIQHKLKLSDEVAMRIFGEVLAEAHVKSDVQKNTGRTVQTAKITAAKAAISEGSEEDNSGGIPKGKRITYESFDEFEKEQSMKDPLKKRFMPIAKIAHELIVSTFKENNMPYEVRYGDGTFSFSVPKGIAKSRTRTCVRFGLVNFKKNSSYFDSIYKNAADELPEGTRLMIKDDPTRYFYNFSSIDDFESVKPSLKIGIIKSYKLLAEK